MKLFSRIAVMFLKPKKRGRKRNTIANKIIASFDAGNTTKEGICAEFPNSDPAYIRFVLKKNGRKWVRTTYGGLNTRDRDAEIVNLRRSGMKLTEIGEKYGISRARVWQIIVRLAPDLTDEMARETRLGPKQNCAVCGVEFPHRNSERKTCGSPDCHAVYMASRPPKLTAMQREYGEKILSLRAIGMTWKEISRHVWRDIPEAMGDQGYAAHAQKYAKIYAKKTGENISWAFSGTKGVNSPRLAQRIVEACRQSGSRFAVRDAAE